MKKLLTSISLFLSIHSLAVIGPFPGSNTSSSGGGVSAAITSINGNTNAAQTITSGTSGTDVAVSSAAGTTTINIPNASATARGVISTGAQTLAGAKTFSSPILGPDGSISAASFSFSSSGNSDNGLFLAANDVVGIAAAGKKSITWEDSYTKLYTPQNEDSYIRIYPNRAGGSANFDLIGGFLQNWNFRSQGVSGTVMTWVSPDNNSYFSASVDNSNNTDIVGNTNTKPLRFTSFSGITIPNISGACAAGTVGQLRFDTDNSCGQGAGKLIVCTVAGSPGTWVALH